MVERGGEAAEKEADAEVLSCSNYDLLTRLIFTNSLTSVPQTLAALTRLPIERLRLGVKGWLLSDFKNRKKGISTENNEKRRREIIINVKCAPRNYPKSNFEYIQRYGK